MPIVTIEELMTMVVICYFLSCLAIAIGLILLAKHDEEKARKRREKFKNDIADEVCSRVLGADYVDKKH